MLLAITIHWFPFVSTLWTVLVVAGLLALLAHGSIVLARKQVPGRWIGILAALRLAIIATFLLVLLQPVITYSSQMTEPPDLLVLLDISPSMSLPSGTANQSRLDELRTELTKNDLADHLRKHYQLHWATFDRTAQAIRDKDVADLEPRGTTTKYAESLAAAAKLLPGGRRPNRVLLVSDGHDHGGGDPAETARRGNLVVDVLWPSSPTDATLPADIAIDDIQHARRVLIGSDTHFRVTLRCVRPAVVDRSLKLQMFENDKSIRERGVVFPKGVRELHLVLAHRPETPGLHTYEFRAGASAGRVQVQAVERKNEVLILEDTWRWDFKFLRRVIEDDPSLRYTAILARDGGAFTQFASPDRRGKLVGIPQTRTDLEGFDTFLLGDANPKRWPRGLAEAVAQMVREDGKSLVVVAGPNLVHLADVPELRALLPVELPRDIAQPLAGPVEVRVTRDGAATPFFEVPAGDKSITTQLPTLDQIYPPLRKRPAAIVLLEAAKSANSYGNLIVMAEQTVGRGRVLYVGTDTLWKWQMLAPLNEQRTTPYSVFWQQALRALTPVRLPQDGIQFWIAPNRTRVERGSSVALRADIASDRPLPARSVQATVVLPDERRVPLAFAADPMEPDAFRAEFTTPIPGSYSIQAKLLSEGKLVAETVTALDVTDSSSELSEFDVNHAALERIAQATGGKAIDSQHPDSWPVSAADRPREIETRTLHLWNNWTLMIMLLGLLGMDWFLRLVRGYV